MQVSKMVTLPYVILEHRNVISAQKFNKARVNGGSNYDSLMTPKWLVI